MASSGKKKLVCNDVEINLELVYDVAGNDTAFVALMIETFFKSMPGTMEKMEQYCAAEDWDNLFKSAHFAKSSYSIINVSGMLDLVKEIEVNAKAKTNLHTLPTLVQAALKKYKRAAEMLQAEFNISS